MRNEVRGIGRTATRTRGCVCLPSYLNSSIETPVYLGRVAQEHMSHRRAREAMRREAGREPHRQSHRHDLVCPPPCGRRRSGSIARRDMQQARFHINARSLVIATHACLVFVRISVDAARTCASAR